MAEQLQFDRIVNFRDVGTFTNAISKSTKLNEGLLYRSARPDAASPEDQDRLVNDLKVHTVIDLRSKTEHLEQARKMQAQSQSQSQSQSPPTAEPLAPSNAQAATLVKIPGLKYKEVNLNGSSFSMALMRQLSFFNTIKLGCLMGMGYRTQAISVLATNVMAPRGLIGLGYDSLAHSKGEIKEVFTTLADEEAYPILVHCTQGKDRTGLVVLLLCMLCGVDTAAMGADYMATQAGLKGERAEKLEEVRSIGLPDSFADCDPEWVEKVMEHITTQYGGIQAYLRGCGVTDAMMERITRKMLR